MRPRLESVMCETSTNRKKWKGKRRGGEKEGEKEGRKILLHGNDASR